MTPNQHDHLVLEDAFVCRCSQNPPFCKNLKCGFERLSSKWPNSKVITPRSSVSRHKSDMCNFPQLHQVRRSSCVRVQATGMRANNNERQTSSAMALETAALPPTISALFHTWSQLHWPHSNGINESADERSVSGETDERTARICWL